MDEMLTSIIGSYLMSQRVGLNWVLIVSRIEGDTFPGFLSSRVYTISSLNPLNSQTNIPLPTDEKTNDILTQKRNKIKFIYSYDSKPSAIILPIRQVHLNASSFD